MNNWKKKGKILAMQAAIYCLLSDITMRPQQLTKASGVSHNFISYIDFSRYQADTSYIFIESLSCTFKFLFFAFDVMVHGHKITFVLVSKLLHCSLRTHLHPSRELDSKRIAQCGLGLLQVSHIRCLKYPL